MSTSISEIFRSTIKELPDDLYAALLAGGWSAHVADYGQPAIYEPTRTLTIIREPDAGMRIQILTLLAATSVDRQPDYLAATYNEMTEVAAQAIRYASDLVKQCLQQWGLSENDRQKGADWYAKLCEYHISSDVTRCEHEQQGIEEARADLERTPAEAARDDEEPAPADGLATTPNTATTESKTATLDAKQARLRELNSNPIHGQILQELRKAAVKATIPGLPVRRTAHVKTRR